MQALMDTFFRTPRSVRFTAMALIFAWGVLGGVNPAAEAEEVATLDGNVQSHPIRFVPPSDPNLPTHSTRVIGTPRSQTRSGDDSPIELLVLVPEQVACSIEAQPCLFWYLTGPVDDPIKINLYTPDAPEPILDLHLDGSKLQGIQRLDLARLSVRLRPEVRYNWVVTILSHADEPSKNRYARSAVWRVRPSPATQEQLEAGNAWNRANVAAELGLWIDALAGISDLIDQNPQDLTLRRNRADLLRQADFDVDIVPTPAGNFMEMIRLATVPSP